MAKTDAFCYAKRMSQRLLFKIAVYLILKRDDQYLFMQRHQTGYCDGLFSLPAGHVDQGETPIQATIREGIEEIGIEIREQDLELVHVISRQDCYINLFFLTKSWKGEPRNLELHKCSQLIWSSPTDIQGRLAPEVESGLKGFEAGRLYTELPI